MLPLYPQFSISTSGSSLRLLQQMFEADPELDGLRHCVIASWCGAVSPGQEAEEACLWQ